MAVPFYLAPMASLSHRAFRELLEDYGGCDIYYSEMIGAAPFLTGGRFESYYADPLPSPEKLVYQIVGGDPEELKKAAKLLDERKTFGIDVNMGCSAPEIVRSGAGVWWMSNQEKAKQMISGVREVVSSRLSVKLRLGPDENYERLLGFCRMLEGEGVDFLTLHPRTSDEKFRRKARWEFVGRLRDDLSIPLAGNGDVDSAKTMLERASGNCDGVMTGRAAIQKPWIFAQAREIERNSRTLPEKIDMEALAFRFLDLLVRHQPSEFHESRAKRFFYWYCNNLTWAHHLRTLINRETETGGMKRVLASYFNECPDDRFLSL